MEKEQNPKSEEKINKKMESTDIPNNEEKSYVIDGEGKERLLNKLNA